MKTKIALSVASLLFCLVFSAEAQTLAEARSLYSQGEYEKALPVFKRELKYARNDASINYWYGSCLYHTGSIQEAVPYLQKGENGRIKEASFLLADCARKAHDYEECLRHIDRYILYNTGKHKAELAAMLKEAERVRQMTENVEDVVFLDSITVPASEIVRHIRLHTACGTLSDRSYRTEKGDRIFQADSVPHIPAGDSVPRNDLDLFVHNRMLDTWEKTPLDDNINKAGSHQTHPYVLSDGITLYFASDEPGGLGGFDLYVSRYNDYLGGYYTPELLPMPFNSFGNDLMYIVDEQANRGYLVTDRNGYHDSLTLYTFVPNAQRRLLKGKSRKELASFAALSSIAATQEGVNVDSIRASQEAVYREADKFNASPDRENRPKPSEGFIIRDNLVYTKASDFKCPEAGKAFEAYQKIEADFRASEKRLNEARTRYSEMERTSPSPMPPSKAKVQADLSRAILKEEMVFYDLSRKMEEAANNIRRLEIAYLH